MAASVTVETAGDGLVTWSYPDTDTSMTHSHTMATPNYTSTAKSWDVRVTQSLSEVF